MKTNQNKENMKKIFMMLVAVMVVAAGSGNDLNAREKGYVKGNALAQSGYVGNIGVSLTPFLGFGAEFTTSHGYGFGNGLWMGGGFGVSASSDFGVLLPLFAEVKYSILRNMKVSPFIDCRLGLITDFDNTVVLFSPSFGVDIDRFSVFAQLNSIGGANIFSLGAAWNFR